MLAWARVQVAVVQRQPAPVVAHWSLRAQEHAPEPASELVASAAAPLTRQRVLAQASEAPLVSAPAARWQLQAQENAQEAAPELAEAARMRQRVLAEAPLDWRCRP